MLHCYTNAFVSAELTTRSQILIADSNKSRVVELPMCSLKVDDLAIQALVDDELADDEWLRVALFLAHNPAAMRRYRQLYRERELLTRLGAPGGEPQGGGRKRKTFAAPAPGHTSAAVEGCDGKSCDNGRGSDKASRSRLLGPRRSTQTGRKRAGRY